jgi:Uma2 family endonuclease
MAVHARSESVFPLKAQRQYFPLRIRPATRLSDDALYDLCAMNQELRIERTAEGEIIVISPTGGETGRRNGLITMALGAWAERDGTGVFFDSSTGFLLPNGAERAPDAAWVRRERWNALTPAQREKFPPLCPDFIVELRSPSDALEEQQAKMEEWAANGARLGWLIDPITRRVWVYEGTNAPVCHDDAAKVNGDPVLPGFVLDLSRVW